jgi:hypothetical protein
MATITRIEVTASGCVEVPLTADEITVIEADRKFEKEEDPKRTMSRIRFERDHLLQQTDWWGAEDQTMNEAQKTYRQALRDYPATYEADNSSAFPIKP